jgi:hypothetical protein
MRQEPAQSETDAVKPPSVRRERTPEEEQEWLDDKRAEYEADRICGHDWSNI